MTSKVALQVDRLASSLVDESIGTIKADSQPAREQQQQQKQKQQLEQREHQHKANLTSPSQSPPDPSPNTLLTSSSASSSSSSSASSQDLIDTVDNNNEARSQDLHQKSQFQPKASGSSSTSLAETTTTTVCGIKAKKRKMGNDLDYLNDSGIPMDGVELDSPSVTRSGIISPLQLASPTNSTVNPAASSTANSNNQTNNINSKTNNEAIASDSPTLSFGDDSKCSANYAYEFDIATKELQLQSGSAGPNVGAGSGEALGGTNRNTDESFQNSQSDKNQTNHQMNSVRSFGDLFDDDDLD